MSFSIGKETVSVSPDDLKRVEAPEATETWFPTKHSDVLDVVESTLASAEYEVTFRLLLVGHEGNTFFGTLDISSSVTDGVNLMVGVRNSNNRRFPMSLCAGTRVLVCSNGCFFGNIEISKRHTRNGKDRYKEGIGNAISQLNSFQAEEAERIQKLKAKQLSDDEANSIILQSFEKGIVGARMLPKLIEEWRKPSHESYEERTGWSLLNSYTEVVKDRLEKPPSKSGLRDDVILFTLHIGELMNRRNERRDNRQEPVHSIRHRANGGTIEAAIFENKVGEGRDKRTVLNVSINRSWHDGKEWQDTKIMRVQDLPALMLLSQEAYQWCQNEMEKSG